MKPFATPPVLSPARRRTFVALAAVGSVALVLVAGEVLARLAGFAPWRVPARAAAEPKHHEPDPVLGWRNQAGRFVIRYRQGPSRELRMTFLPDGRRLTVTPPGATRSLVLVGDSFTQGWAVSDDETYAWRLQERFPEVAVLNYGVGGFGTYQSLLRLAQVLPAAPSPAAVVYGFIEEHEARNVAGAQWLETIARFAYRGPAALPYATLAADGALVPHGPVTWPSFPLRRVSALATFAERLWVRARAHRRFAERGATTEALIGEMAALAATRGAPLVVAIFLAEPATVERYRAALEPRGIFVADCSFPLTPELQVPGEGHPNPTAHARYADCLARLLGERFGWIDGRGPG